MSREADIEAAVREVLRRMISNGSHPAAPARAPRKTAITLPSKLNALLKKLTKRTKRQKDAHTLLVALQLLKVYLDTIESGGRLVTQDRHGNDAVWDIVD